jgi:hypothetical protein
VIYYDKVTDEKYMVFPTGWGIDVFELKLIISLNTLTNNIQQL